MDDKDKILEIVKKNEGLTKDFLISLSGFSEKHIDELLSYLEGIDRIYRKTEGKTLKIFTSLIEKR